MRVLLLTPVGPVSYQVIPDLGLMYLAASLRRSHIGVSIIDCRREQWGLDELAHHVRARMPTIVGIKCYSHEQTRVQQMAETVRESSPGAVVVIGGPHPSVDAAGALEHMTSVDYAFLGEAERSLVAFARWVERGGLRGTPPADIHGIAWRDGHTVEVRPPVFEDDVDSMAKPAWDLMRPDRYPDEAAGVFVPEFPAAPMLLSRGCPYPCAYCGCSHVAGKSIRYRSVENVLAEVDHLEEAFGVRTLTFVDDNFTCDRGRALELFEALASRTRRMNFTFPNGVRVDRIDEELLTAMERAGCSLVALGIESGSDEVLTRMRKQQSVSQAEHAVRLIRRVTAMQVTGFFILGYPGEAPSDVRRTILFANRLAIHHAHFCLFIPIPGTPVYEALVASGEIDPHEKDPETLTIDHGSLALPGLSLRRLRFLHQMAYLRFYSAPWRILNLVRQLRSPGHLRLVLRRFRKLFPSRRRPPGA